MDSEVKTALGELTHAVTTLSRELRAEMKQQGEELRAEMKQQGEELRAEMKQQGEELRAEIREGDRETRNHLGAMIEDLDGQVKLIAEGHRVLVEKTERIEHKLDKVIEDHEMTKLRVTALESRKPRKRTRR